jgi:hypothetical protein
LNANSRNILVVVLFFLFLIVLAWLIQRSYNQSQTSQSSRQSPAVGRRTKDFGCTAQGPLPDKQCTPGAIFEQTTASEICVSGYSKKIRHVPKALKDAVYSEYGIKRHSPGEYEVDHLISLELGGSNDIANLWPEPAEPRPGFHEKDKVENYLHSQVCSGRIDLKKAQAVIANDWMSVYKNMN